MNKAKLKDAKKALEIALEEDTIQNIGDAQPGMIVGKGTGHPMKVPYTLNKLKDLFPEVTFTPEETIPVTYQGVKIQLIADREITVPEPFKGIYDDYRKAKRNPTLPPGVHYAPGAGGLEPEKTVERV